MIQYHEEKNYMGYNYFHDNARYNYVGGVHPYTTHRTGYLSQASKAASI